VSSRNFRHSALEIFGLDVDFRVRLDAFAATAFLVACFVVEDTEALFFRDEV
jgi:hypothetical protein